MRLLGFFLAQFLSSLDACEAACSVINIFHKLLKDCMGSSLISSDETAGDLRLSWKHFPDFLH